MSLIMVIMVAISLSMDAFSLSIAYGTLNIEKKQINYLSVIVGLYHFFMPLFGMFVGKQVVSLLPIKTSTLVFIVLFFIGVEMIFETFKEEKNIKILSLLEMLLFGFAVSLDSFSVGLGLKVLYKDPLVAAFIFSISSFIFTYIGLLMGKKINNIVGKLATLFGGITLIILGIIYLLQ